MSFGERSIKKCDWKSNDAFKSLCSHDGLSHDSVILNYSIICLVVYL